MIHQIHEKKMLEIKRFERLFDLFIKKDEVIVETKSIAEWFQHQLQEVDIETTILKQKFGYYKIK